MSLDRSLVWRETAFEPRDAIQHCNDGSVKEIPGGWDHEHCVICFAKIWLQENRMYMESNRGDIICLDCYRKYVRPGNIDFIEIQ